MCADHVTDAYLRDWIPDNATSTSCDVCGSDSNSPIAADLGDLAELIFQGLTREWADEAEEVPWGMGYDGTMSTRELLEHEEVTNDERLTDALADVLPDYGWVQRDFFVLSEHERLTQGWRSFTTLIKHHSRFFFSLRDRNPDDPDDIAPLGILAKLGQAVSAAGLMRTWRPGTAVFRARLHDPGEEVLHAWQLAALPEDLANRAAANRMSGAGIPLFYGASTAEAAANEARSVEPETTDKVVTVGCFEARRDLQILDLSDGVEVPSLFDPERGHLRATLAFLRAFLEEMSRPVTRGDGQEHIDYVPTQVVCEYFRSVHQFEDGVSLDGIVYPSTQTPGETDVVLFVSNLEVEDADGTRPPLPERLRVYGPLFPRDPVTLRLRDVLGP